MPKFLKYGFAHHSSDKLAVACGHQHRKGALYPVAFRQLNALVCVQPHDNYVNTVGSCLLVDLLQDDFGTTIPGRGQESVFHWSLRFSLR